MRRGEERFPTRRSQDWELNPWSEARMMRPGSLFGASPWQMMRRMQEDMDHLFEQLVGGSGSSGLATSGAEGQGSMAQWSPSVDISQSDREWCIEADLPGVDKEAIDVQVRDHHLILSAEMRDDRQPQESSGDQRQYHRRERRYGYFQRVIPLPQNVREDDISCDFRNGVLTVHLPKADSKEPGARRIPVYSADDLPSETAAGRRRSQQEMEMTEMGSMDGDEEHAMAGAKGGETSSPEPAAKPASKGRSTRSKKPTRTEEASG